MQGPIRRALVSVFDKEGAVDLCRALHLGGVEILSSGGTARLLRDHQIPCWGSTSTPVRPRCSTAA